MKTFPKIYPKLLLLGEYSILQGGNAITLPLRLFSASFDYMENTVEVDQAFQSNKSLIGLAQFFNNNELITDNIDVDSLLRDLQEGLYFRSTIPENYGIGSSGSVCAAILKSYSKFTLSSDFAINEILKLKVLFASMESFFHGKSSGLDPLACYYSHPLLFRNELITKIQDITLPVTHWFLLDSGCPRSSRNLIKTFMQNANNPEYKKSFINNYMPVVDELINKIVEPGRLNSGEFILNQDKFLNLWKSLSILQSHIFKDMIPEDILKLWHMGLDSDLFYLKLLGAGGGGFFLGYTDLQTDTETFLSDRGYRLISMNL